MTEIVLAGAVRTPIGSFNDGLRTVPAHVLGQTAIGEALKRADVDAKGVPEVFMRQILTAGEGQNAARQAAIGAGIPSEATAYTIIQVCGPGSRSVALGYQAIRGGESSIVIAGGQENMSHAPHCVHLRDGAKMGQVDLVDTMIRDGLSDVSNGYHMGTTAENVARRYQFLREEQDQLAARSQARAGEDGDARRRPLRRC